MAILRTLRVSALASTLIWGTLSSCDRLSHGGTGSRATPAPPATPEVTAPPRAAALLAPGAPSIADVAARATPSVVNVFSEKVVTPPSSEDSPFFSNPFFHFFFDQPGGGLRETPRRREQSLGSGVIIGADGVIITNNHVVAQADKIRVSLHDGRELQAKLVGADPKSDVAVLHVDAKGLPAIGVADSSKIRIGDLVLAIGNPFGIGQTVTMGIVSAVGRANMGITDYEDFIQTDAAINPGNSGGALVTMEGQLVGINTAIVSRSGGYQGIGFAIPSNMAMAVKDAILEHGKVIRGWLGVAIQDLDEPLAKSLHLPSKTGVLVSDVTPGSPAAGAGLERGDVITAVDGIKTNDAAHLRNLIALGGKGKTVHLALLRQGQEKTLDVTLGEAPADGARGRNAPSAQGAGVFEGIDVRTLDPAARRQLRVPDNVHGVLVERIDPQSAAASTGLRPGDVIVEVNRTATPSVDAFEKAAGESGGQALVLVYRDGGTFFLALSK